MLNASCFMLSCLTLHAFHFESPRTRPGPQDTRHALAYFLRSSCFGTPSANARAAARRMNQGMNCVD
eukprot:366128-Chlamydomonas_euryale.AAC.8